MDSRPEFPAAFRFGLAHLYHYQDFDLNSRDSHVGRLTDILKNHRIWCSDPTTFNDPWDGKPYFAPAHLDDDEIRSKTVEALISTRRGSAELDHVDALLRSDPMAIKAMVHKFSLEFIKYVPDRWAIYCLAPDPSVNLMWSHYARNHKGMCLEFAVSNTKFAWALQVQYHKKYPPFLLHDQHDYGMLLAKSDDWVYENEFRLIGVRSIEFPSPMVLDGHYLPINDTDLKSIIFGCQMEEDAKASVRAIVREHAPNVVIRQAVRSFNEYRLAIDPDAKAMSTV
jgi:hypothetical protein